MENKIAHLTRNMDHEVRDLRYDTRAVAEIRSGRRDTQTVREASGDRRAVVASEESVLEAKTERHWH